MSLCGEPPAGIAEAAAAEGIMCPGTQSPYATPVKATANIKLIARTHVAAMSHGSNWRSAMVAADRRSLAGTPISAGLADHFIAMTMNERAVPQLYLITPPLKDRDGTAEELAAALAAAPFAAVLARLADGDERTLIKRVKTIAPLVQRAGTALILDGHEEIVAKSGADGAHLFGIDAFTAHAPSLKPDRIAGAGGLLTKHDAMLAAEQGADYVTFGEPDAEGHRPPFETILERVQWWAEVFETPCVAYANDASEIVRLARTGAEFVAVGDFVFGDARGIVAAVSAIARDIQSLEIAR